MATTNNKDKSFVKPHTLLIVSWITKGLLFRRTSVLRHIPSNGRFTSSVATGISSSIDSIWMSQYISSRTIYLSLSISLETSFIL